MKIVFLGTPEAARISLARLAEAGYRPEAVITRSDKPAGRGRRLTPPPVKVEAQRLGLPVLQMDTARDGRMMEILTEIQPDLLIVVALSLLLPPEVLKLPRIMPLNLHFSLLPAFRGAAPVNWAIIRGAGETGATTMKITDRLDSGPILRQVATPIGPRETAGELFARLSRLGADLLKTTLDDLVAGRADLRTQDESAVTWAPSLTAVQGRLDFTRPAGEVFNLGRGVIPWPGAQAPYGRTWLKVFDLDLDEAEPRGEPGEIVGLAPHGLRVACGQGHLYLGRIQHPNRKPVSAAEAVRGAGPRPGEFLR